MAEWLRRLTCKPKVRTAVGSNPMLDSLAAVHDSSPGQPEPCEGNLVAAGGSCDELMVKHPWPLLEISLSDFHGLATLNINTNLPKASDASSHTSVPKTQKHCDSENNHGYKKCSLWIMKNYTKFSLMKSVEGMRQYELKIQKLCSLA